MTPLTPGPENLENVDRGRLAELASHWGWFVVLGILLLLLGFAALGSAFIVTVATLFLFGIFLIIGGLGHFFHAFSTRNWGGFFWECVGAVLYVLAGIAVMARPLVAGYVFTLFLGCTLLAGGLLRILLALQHRDNGSWLFLLVSGLIGIVVGGLIIAGLPQDSLVLLGVIIAIELIASGFSWIVFGFALRRLKRNVA